MDDSGLLTIDKAGATRSLVKRVSGLLKSDAHRLAPSQCLTLEWNENQNLMSKIDFA